MLPPSVCHQHAMVSEAGEVSGKPVSRQSLERREVPCLFESTEISHKKASKRVKDFVIA